jgi:hypothetical protein
VCPTKFTFAKVMSREIFDEFTRFSHNVLTLENSWKIQIWICSKFYNLRCSGNLKMGQLTKLFKILKFGFCNLQFGAGLNNWKIKFLPRVLVRPNATWPTGSFKPTADRLGNLSPMTMFKGITPPGASLGSLWTTSLALVHPGLQCHVRPPLCLQL